MRRSRRAGAHSPPTPRAASWPRSTRVPTRANSPSCGARRRSPLGTDPTMRPTTLHHPTSSPARATLGVALGLALLLGARPLAAQDDQRLQRIDTTFAF